MKARVECVDELIEAWHTNHRVTVFLFENLSREMWLMKIPNSRRSVRSLCAHIHNARCMWIKMIGEKYSVKVPKTVEFNKVSQSQLVRALDRSSKGIVDLILLATKRGGHIPPAAWQNFPTDVVHFLSYFIAHEAHHRGQIVLAAKQLGHPLPKDVRSGLWQWKARRRET